LNRPQVAGFELPGDIIIEDPLPPQLGFRTIFEWTNTVTFVPNSAGMKLVSICHGIPGSGFKVGRYCTM